MNTDERRAASKVVQEFESNPTSLPKRVREKLGVLLKDRSAFEKAVREWATKREHHRGSAEEVRKELVEHLKNLK